MFNLNYFKKEIKKNGYKIYYNNFFKINENTLKEFYDLIAETNIKKLKTEPMLNDYPFYKKDLNNNNKIVVVEKTNLFKEIHRIKNEIENFLDNKINVKFVNVWAQESFKSSYDEYSLPYIPHIDKDRYFKVLIYINDVIKDMGPLHLHSCRPDDFENFRLNLPENYMKNKLNNVTKFTKENYKCCEGKFGTTIFFDTNCPHFAGKSTSKKNRYILRYNFKIIKTKSIFNIV